MHAALSEAVHGRREEAVELLTRLVAIDTSNPPGRGYAPIVALLEQELTARSLSCSRHEIPDASADAPRTILRAVSDEGPAAFYFHGHYDVVPANRQGQFDPRVEHGRVVGRGSSDMKGGLVAMILAAEAIGSVGVELPGALVLHFVPDEETGGRLGAAQLERLGLLDARAHGMLLPEPSSGLIWHAHRGALSLMARVRGRAAHVGLPSTGANAVEGAVPLIQAAIDLRRELSGRATALPTGELAEPEGTVVIGGRVEGGTAANAVPADFAFSLDIRFNPEDSLEEIEWRVEELFEQAAAGAVDFDLEVFQRAEPSITDASGPLATSLARQVARLSGAEARFELCPGVLESRFYNAAGVPALSYGPGILEVSHGPAESVRIDEVMRCAEIYASTVLDTVVGGAHRE